MNKITADMIRKLRDETGAPVLRVKKVLEETGGNKKRAGEILKKEGFEKVLSRAGRGTSQGIISAYVHHSGHVASVVELLCETDFVARNDLFRQVAHDLSLQVASMQAKNSKELEKQDFIRDQGKKVSDLIKELKTKTGENIKIGRIFRMELGN